MMPDSNDGESKAKRHRWDWTRLSRPWRHTQLGRFTETEIMPRLDSPGRLIVLRETRRRQLPLRPRLLVSW